MNIVVLSDGGPSAMALVESLRRSGAETIHSASVADAAGLDATADAMLIDPDSSSFDGASACTQVREASDVPIIVISARLAVSECVRVLSAGADDYVPKPFILGELMARIRAVTRRHQMTTRALLDDVEIDFATQVVTVSGERVALAKKEFQLLSTIAAADGMICSRAQLIGVVWGRPWAGVDACLNVNIANMRAKLRRPHLIETVRGAGYRIANGVTIVGQND